MKSDGLTTFEYNPSTGEIQKAQYKPAGIFISSSNKSSRTIETFLLVHNEGCKYLRALNLKNAKRKFFKQHPL